MRIFAILVYALATCRLYIINLVLRFAKLLYTLAISYYFSQALLIWGLVTIIKK